MSETTWLSDANGNRCSVEYFGSEDAARRALDSLVDCRDCTNCSCCSCCSDCSGCLDCSGCSHIASLYDKQNLRGDPENTGPLGQPEIPVIENVHQRVYEAASADDALDMGTWHSCNTTHCRAGWTVHLASEAGYALERYHNTALAAQLIYRASGYDINPCRWYDSDDDALADMKRLAEAA